MYLSVFKHEIYIEQQSGSISWLPLVEDGDEGLVIVFLIFWVAINRKCSGLHKNIYLEENYGKGEDKY